MTGVTVLSGGDEPAVLAFAELVDHGVRRTAFTAAPWISITTISPTGQPARPLQLAGARYNLHIPDTEQTFIGCVARAFVDPVTFDAEDIVDKNGNSLVE